jgi:MFS family permease
LSGVSQIAVDAVAPQPLARAERRWLPVVIAALAMVATLPGRTHGLGLITEPLIADLHLDRVSFAAINLWATLIGAAFCLPCGWLIDRLGGRTVLLGVTLGLAGSVVGVGAAESSWRWLSPALAGLLLLERGFGQSALSVVSLAIMGRSVGHGDQKKSSLGVGVYSFVVAIGFMAAFGAVKHLIEARNLGWRALWNDLGLAVAAFGLLAFFIMGAREPAREKSPTENQLSTGLTLAQSLRTGSFWVFALGTSLYGLIAAGLSLFNQSILAERGFDRGVFLTITMLSPMIGLAANLATGWLAGTMAHGRLMAIALLVVTLALLAFPFVATLAHVYIYAVAMGVAGGMVTVIFFAAWGEGFGTAHLGKIQGAAQMLTVFASAAGPLLIAAGQRASGSYVPVFRWLALATGLLACFAWFARLPLAKR